MTVIKNKIFYASLVLILGVIISSCVKIRDKGQKEIDQIIKEKKELRAFCPHTDEFKKSGHSKIYLKTKKDRLCQMCHGKDLQGGNVKVSCYKCHNYPHLEGWKKASNHGYAFIQSLEREHDLKIYKSKEGFLTCLYCHDLKGELRIKNKEFEVPDCKKCHNIDIPHTGEFKDVMHHSSHSEGAKNFLGDCKVCHAGAGFKNVNIQMSRYQRLLKTEKMKLEEASECARCHLEKEIISKDYDINDLRDSNKLKNLMKDNANCKVCHRENHKPELIDSKSMESEYFKSCAACHKWNEVPFQIEVVDRESGETVKQIKWNKRDKGH